jgi:hypothetical protein
MMFGQFDLGLSPAVVNIVKIIGAVGGAVVGWVVFDPLTRLIYRLSVKKPTPPPVVFLGKAVGAGTLAAVLYFTISLGGGGGLGLGPGQGGLPGKGPGKGGEIVADGKSKDGKQKDKSETPKVNGKLETVSIEILGGKRFEDDGKDRFYLVERKKPAVNIDDVDDYFKKNAGKITVIAVVTKDTAIELDLIGSPLDNLRKRAAQHNIKVLMSMED